MVYLRRPPKIKVLEAVGAIADGRVTLLDDKWAEVTSSSGDRKYRVYVDLQKSEACSTDNGTKFRGYIGYPIISVLMLKGILPYDERIAKALSGIPWKELNEKYKKYSIVEEEIKKRVVMKGVSASEIDEFKEKVYSRIRNLKLRKIQLCEDQG